MVDYWGIHNDQPGIDPLTDDAVRIGWDRVQRDLSGITPTRDGFREVVAAAYPDEPSSLNSSAGTLFRFVNEIAEDDIIVSPNRTDRTLRIGRVSGPYEYRPGAFYRHWRPVEWLVPRVSRDELSEAAQNELGSATTLFRLKTSRPEIEFLLNSGATRSRAPDFSWVPFYTELADKLVAYRHRRGKLLTTLWEAGHRGGVDSLLRFMRKDHLLDGTHGDRTDIDPFTMYSPFNRGTTDVNRTQIAAAYREAFGISAAAPTVFDGIPVVDNRNSWFIGWEDTRADDDIDVLWDLFEAELAYATSRNEQTKETLISAFDAAAGTSGSTRKLTMGAYWIRPEVFTAYDNVNTRFLRKVDPQLSDRLNLQNRLSGEDFLANTEALLGWLASSSSPFDSPPELSRAAWLSQAQPSAAPSASHDDVKATPEGSESRGAELDREYSTAEIISDGSFLEIELLDSMLEELASKKNIILQGPPGTGKTWLARRLGWALCNERGTGRARLLQFHPSMSYEDFVRGYRPGPDGTLTLVDGPLLELADTARNDSENDYVLVIEEVNRGNPAQIFGEMLTLLEHDKRDTDGALNLAYPREGEGPYHLPENLYMIGTMNLADRSIALVDMALRRRFSFFDLGPQFNDAWSDWVIGLRYDESVVHRISTRMAALNDVIGSDTNLGKDYLIGHSYFTPGSKAGVGPTFSERWFLRVVDFQIAPLLAEYWFDNPQQVADQLQRLRTDG